MPRRLSGPSTSRNLFLYYTLAAKTGVLGEAQDVAEKPWKHVKRSVGDLLVRRLLAERIARNLVRMLPEKLASALPAARCLPAPKVYIPVKMPPREVPNCFFQEPQSETWQREHRTVTFMPKESVYA